MYVWPILTSVMITRFAPSPTGYLHLGHAFAALTVWDAAQAAGGVMLLRIEDIDRNRARAEYEAAIHSDLAWLGLRWPSPVLRQSDQMADYAAVLDRLIAAGLVYRCFKTRKDLAEDSANAPHGAGLIVRGGPHKDEATLQASHAPFAWRLSLDAARAHLGPRFETLRFAADGHTVRAQPERLGDVILARKDAPTSYHLASVWDDARQGVTHVIRGEDLAEAAHLHVLLQALLDLPTPVYRHHRLILGADGKRLSKRNGAAALQSLRAAGKNPADIRRLLAL
jgi:glutamyl-Q tRNA(Asp) synthetase